MDFKPIIAKAYEFLGYEPRNGQELIVESVLEEFITKQKKNVILSADTGIGKSIIGAVVAECIKQINQPKFASIILMHQNSLSKQYASSFHHMPESEFFQIKGASNYPCQYMKAVHFKADATGEDCMRKEMAPVEIEKHCKGCEYHCAKSQVNRTQNLITNYSYFYISKLYSDHIAERELQIFDEAHVLNESFCDHTSIHVQADKLAGYVRELEIHGNNKFDDEIRDLKVFEKSVRAKAIKESNYMEQIVELKKLYSRITSKTSKMYELIPDMKDKLKFKRMAKKYAGLSCKIADFIEYEYDHVFDDSIANEVSIRSIFIKDMISLILGKYNLFMSATISRNFAETTYGLEHEETAFIEAKQVFPSENRPLLFLGKTKLNYSNMQDPKTVTDLQNQIAVICSHHATKDEKGLILVPSFALAKRLAEKISGIEVFEHRSGQKIVDLMTDFRACKVPAVLISPSIYEGLDFKGDDSRFQIIVKTPYPSLGDKRISHIATNYPDIYRELALLKIIQGIGRSIRSVEDTAVTYFTDLSSKQLYDSKINVWKNRFVVRS